MKLGATKSTIGGACIYIVQHAWQFILASKWGEITKSKKSVPVGQTV